MIQNIKRIVALLLVLSIFLPLSRCSRPDFNFIKAVFSKKERQEVEADTLKQKNNESEHPKKPVYNYTYAYSNFDAMSLDSWLLIIAFIWPFPLLLYDRYGNQIRLKNTFKVLEPILCLSSGFIIFFASIFGERIYGSYIAFFLLGIYFVMSSMELFNMARSYFTKGNT